MRSVIEKEELSRFLAQSGPVSQGDACQRLGISQPVFSRHVRQIENLLIFGKARATRYALKRPIPLVSEEIPLYAIDSKGTPRLLGTLHPIHRKGFFFESRLKGLEDSVFEDLPYFLEDLRPAGFLGRLIPTMHPEFGFPKNINEWSSNDCLQYLTLFAWNLVGNLVVGKRALELYLAHADQKSNLKSIRASREYPGLADKVLSFGEPGSSAGGEQPKFLSEKSPTTSVLVKFSPDRRDVLSQRISDLLVCEQIIHQQLKNFEYSTPASRILKIGGQTFLESERFDRTPEGGRLGLISLKALDLQYVGSLRSWQESARALRKLRILDEAAYQKIVWLDLFGELIGNSDRHPGNISFYAEGLKPKQLAPVYDMLPMRYAPQNQDLLNDTCRPSLAGSDEPSLWESARVAAIDFWRCVEKEKRISASFKKIARSNRRYLQITK